MSLPYVSELRAVWASMISRCYNDKLESWSNYGGRGITVCERWRDSFEAFYFDLHDGYRPDLQLDRFPDNEGNYQPGNVRWATREQQANNTRTNRYVEVDGKRITVSDLARDLGVPRDKLYNLVGVGTPKGPRGSPTKDVIPLPLGTREWVKSDDQRVYEAIVAYRRDHDVTSVAAVARLIGMDRKHVERVIVRLKRTGLVETPSRRVVTHDVGQRHRPLALVKDVG